MKEKTDRKNERVSFNTSWGKVSFYIANKVQNRQQKKKEEE